MFDSTVVKSNTGTFRTTIRSTALLVVEALSTSHTQNSRILSLDLAIRSPAISKREKRRRHANLEGEL
jgi:hypothetical protein